MSIKAKRYEFAQPTLVIQVNEDSSEVNFIAIPISKLKIGKSAMILRQGSGFVRQEILPKR